MIFFNSESKGQKSHTNSAGSHNNWLWCVRVIEANIEMEANVARCVSAAKLKVNLETTAAWWNRSTDLNEFSNSQVTNGNGDWNTLKKRESLHSIMSLTC